MASTIKVNNIQNQCGANIANKCGTTITLGASGDTITLACGASQTGFGRTGTVDWDTTAKTASFTAVSGNGYFVNTTSGAITVTLPASPSSGDIVSVSDYNGTASTNAITIARNGSNINGNASDYIITKADSAITFVYVDATVGWTSVNTSNTVDNQNPFIVATGGTITCCGDYKIHTFTGPGTFTVTDAGTPAGSDTVDYLVVAGGGGGGHGGAGAGGVRFFASPDITCYPSSPRSATVGLSVPVQAYPITVGSGGTGTNSGEGGNGNPSIFSTITSTAGGGGGDQVPAPGITGQGRPGGSGGGVGRDGAPYPAAGAGNTPPVSPSQGSPGGLSPTVGYSGGGGGGGFLNTGGNATGGPPSAVELGGNGGDGGGFPTSFVGSNGQPSSCKQYFGGGGGGGANGVNPAAGSAGQPGLGGGGIGGIHPGSPVPRAAGAGTANTGGGAGGVGATSMTAANGGSGIVIIRYKYQ